MRNLEKGLLLAELINFDSSSQKDVKSFILWIRSQDCYDSLLQRVKKLKTSTSFYARYLYNEFISIDLEKVRTIEEGFIVYAKILYLHQIITPGYYINPLLIINKKERKYRLGDIVVFFNNKYLTLDEFSQNQDYSFQEKYEFILAQVRKWQKDIEEKILYPIGKLSDNPRNLPKLKVVPLSYLFVGILYLISLGLLTYLSYFFSNQVKETLFHFDLTSYKEINYFFLMATSFAILGFVIYIIELIIRKIKYGHYFKYHKVIIEGKDKVLDTITESKNKLENYLVSSIDKNQVMNTKVFKFSSCYYLFEYIIYLYQINYHYKKIRKDHLSLLSKILFTFTIIFLILFVVFFLLFILGGNL